MSDQFLTKTRISLDECVELEATLVLERFSELRALLLDRLGPEAAALFAEPLLSRGNDAAQPSVSWYSDRPGMAQPLSTLSPALRAEAKALLTAQLRPVHRLADSGEAGPLLTAALTLRDADSVWVAGGRPVLINWGLLPAAARVDAAARRAHHAMTLGRFIPSIAESQARPAAMEPSAPTATPTAVASPPAQETAADGASRRVGLRPVAWVPLTLLLLIAGATLAWLLLPGTRLFPPSTAGYAVTDERAAALAEQVNRDLRARRAALETALHGAVCRADGALVLPDGRTPDGLLPPPPEEIRTAPGTRAEGVPGALLPPPPERVVLPSGVAGDTVTEAGNVLTLLDQIEARTVMVLTTAEGSTSGGSGFVVGPGLIVTNHHVIAEALASDGRIFVIHAALGSPQRADVIRAVGPLEREGADFALLRIAATDLPAYELLLPDNSLKLTNVVAAGFPGDVLQTDPRFSALLRGDGAAVPDLTVTQGAISTEQSLSPGTNVLGHSAPISQGNSGGPLVDMCGRVVGVNTFVRQGPMRNMNFALSAGDLVAFLADTPAQGQIVSSACVPMVLRAGAPVDADPAPSSAPLPASAPDPDTAPDAAPSTSAPPLIPLFPAPAQD
jgi:S1-C subfamily serine protease